MSIRQSPAPPAGRPSPSDPRVLSRFDARVRTALVRRDRERLADAVAALTEAARAASAPQPGAGVGVPDQVLLAGPVLRDIERVLRGEEPLDTRGVHLVGALLHDVRSRRMSPGDPLCVDEAAREARRALRPHRVWDPDRLHA